jgi:2-dehydropantoate 2-reductase
MNIVVFGAGAIGSLFGGILAKNNNVVLVGRKDHVEAIRKNGLKIKGKTKATVKVSAFETVKDISFSPDLIIISVKSYDTEKAACEIKKVMSEDTFVMSLQNGLDNIEKIEKFVDKKKLFVCITTHGSVFFKPGVVKHTGVGKTKIGGIVKSTSVEERFVDLFNKSGIKTTLSDDVVSDIWAKAIVNSSINPLTCFFRCKNGYILKNPVLEKIMERICHESTLVARASGFFLSYEAMLDLTREVIIDTCDNFSSMFQSIQKGRKIEIDSINGFIVRKGLEFGLDVSLNEVVLHSVVVLC